MRPCISNLSGLQQSMHTKGVAACASVGPGLKLANPVCECPLPKTGGGDIPHVPRNNWHRFAQHIPCRHCSDLLPGGCNFSSPGIICDSRSHALPVAIVHAGEPAEQRLPPAEASRCHRIRCGISATAAILVQCGIFVADQIGCALLDRCRAHR